ncbi:hypothetical protein OOK13_19455 [Streptomyces sp. NBC_00378]|uniref:hypothetical protein n=1 Tax=Streptomyces sp. NBC_00378 TaxID=2975732 RepID=UPI0022525053|nr:hypothetical protein [Streptomyces sp. NBC_00378]MCX5110681.1 hypothetical protein [Streptomyces sp. NBC_00378]
MSTRPTTGLHLAGPAEASDSSGAPKVVGREAVPSSVRSDQQTGDGRYPIAWLTISAPRGAVPTATSICECGRNLFAAGHRKALALIDDHNRHRTRCPLRTTEERNAS